MLCVLLVEVRDFRVMQLDTDEFFLLQGEDALACRSLSILPLLLRLSVLRAVALGWADHHIQQLYLAGSLDIAVIGTSA